MYVKLQALAFTRHIHDIRERVMCCWRGVVGEGERERERKGGTEKRERTKDRERETVERENITLQYKWRMSLF